MTDIIKSKIELNRTEFDDLTPKPETRRLVLKAVRPVPLVPLILWKAAAVIFFASTVYLGIERFGRPESPMADAAGFEEIEAFYQGELSRRTQWLGQSGNWESASADLIQLESMYDVLHEQWSVQPTKQLQDAMTLNLIVRVRKMDDLLAEKHWQ